MYMLASTSCKDNASHLPTVNLAIDLTISQLSDSTYISDTRSLICCNNHYYLSDYNRDQIFILDENLQLKKTLGQKGKGPGELLGASTIQVYNDTIFVFNDAKRCFELFNSEEHLQTINLFLEDNFSSDMRFAVKNNDIYLTNPYAEHSISRYNYKSGSVQFFGKSTEYRTPRERRIKNHRHVHISDNRIIAIPNCQPFIEIYTLDGRLIASYDLSNIDKFKQNIEYIERNNYSENSYFNFIADSYLLDDRIFILLRTVDKSDKVFSNNILELEINDEIISPTRLLNLGDGWYSSFCVSNDNIVAFNNTTAELVRYAY